VNELVDKLAVAVVAVSVSISWCSRHSLTPFHLIDATQSCFNPMQVTETALFFSLCALSGRKPGSHYA
jgi:hypothetical protein